MRSLSLIRKDGDCRASTCPAMYDAADDVGTAGHVVQGKQLALKDDARPGFVVYGRSLTADELSHLSDLGDDEDGVFVPAGELATRAVPDTDPVRPSAPGESAVWVPATVVEHELAAAST